MEFQFKRYIELQDRPAHSYSNIPVVRLRQLLDNRTAVALLCIIATGWALIVIWQLRLSPQTTDFSHYYTGALLMREGTNPYTTDLSPIAARMHMNLNGNTRATYPPTFELLFAQLTRLPPKQAFWLWTVFNIGLLALIIRWLTEQLRECNPRIATAAIALAILYPPLTIHLKEAQTQILVCFLLVAMIRGLQRGHSVIAGLAVSAAILLRIYPATMAGYSLARRRWLLFGSLCFGVAVGGAITCACVGIGRSLSFIQSVPLIKSPLFFRAGDNIAIEAELSKLFWLIWGMPLPRVPAIFLIGLTISLQVGLVATTYLITRRTPNSDTDVRISTLWVMTMLVVAPTVWVQYLVILFIPFAVILTAWVKGVASRRVTNLASASYVISAACQVIASIAYRFNGNSMNIASFFAQQFTLAALVMCYVASAWLALERTSGTQISL